MNDGVIFFWFAWIIWTFATFVLNKKNKNRFAIAIHCLISMILVDKFLSFNNLSISFTIIYLILVAFISIRSFPIKKIIYCFFTVMGYVMLRMFYLLDPALFIVSEVVILTASIILISYLFFDNCYQRIFNSLIMILVGEIVFANIIMNMVSINYKIGVTVLDLSTSIIFFFFFTYVLNIIMSYWKKLIKQSTIQKQKELIMK